MKRFASLLCTLTLALGITACTTEPAPEEVTLPLGAYTITGDEADILMAPTLTLMADNQATLVSSPFSSYLGMGTYEIEGNSLVLTTGDGENVYVFSISSGELLFEAEKSSAMNFYAERSMVVDHENENLVFALTEPE